MARRLPKAARVGIVLLRGALYAASVAGSCTTARAHAQPDSKTVSTVEGHVVEIQGEDVVVDLAQKAGASEHDLIELWRPITLRHPVTRQPVSDRFRTGTLRLFQVQTRLSLARAEGELLRAPAVGDVVVLTREIHEPALRDPGDTTPAPVPPAASVAPPPRDADARAVTELFDGLRGADIGARIRAYEAHATSHPRSRFAAVLYEEAQALRMVFREKKPAEHAAALEASVTLPVEALAGVALDVAVEIRGGARGAVLQARNAGEVAYRATPMEPAGERYFVARVEGDRVQSPAIELFVEAVDEEGRSIAVVGDSNDPRAIRVHEIPRPEPPSRPLAVVSIFSDYADFNQLEGNDRTWQTEGFFGMRFRDEGVRALRTGFGVYRGVGGSLRELDELGLGARRVGLTYGYLETEIAFSHYASLLPRAIVGLRSSGISGGAQALVRIGNDRETNLQIGGEVLGGIGLRGITQLELGVFERVPIVFRTEVTNQPAGSEADLDDVEPVDDEGLPELTSRRRGEIGIRAIVSPGFRITDDLTLAVRASWQGRNVTHSGPGLGGAVTYEW